MNPYQGSANDPLPYIPAIVDDAQVFYQKTPIDLAKTGLVNFWGRVPVAAAPGVPVHYADLTGPGVSHSGDFDVRDWYWKNIVPLLGDGPAFSDPGLLTAAPAEAGPPRHGVLRDGRAGCVGRGLRPPGGIAFAGRDRTDDGRRPGQLVGRRRQRPPGPRPSLRPLRRRRLPRRAADLRHAHRPDRGAGRLIRRVVRRRASDEPGRGSDPSGRPIVSPAPWRRRRLPVRFFPSRPPTEDAPEPVP